MVRFKDEEPSGRLNPSAGKAESQIGELVERLEALQRQSAQASLHSPARSFRWEADSEGLIFWVEGAPRGPLVGQSIASPAPPGGFGVDGQAAGAFKRRAPFRDARFSVAGEGAASGDWRISGVAFFDPKRGNFLGYRGSARRPRMDETAARSTPARGLFGTHLPPDALRQLIHELRTPLNAIVGFAEMIEGEYLGPAGESYRTRANTIRGEAGRLLAAVDDLDTAAQIETRRFSVGESATDIAPLLQQLYGDFERAARHRKASFRVEFAPHLPPARVERASAERMVSRLLAATLGLAEEG
ncbi:MAG TPA: histidine kinase dimerization/phospho-acceptor domain-containing protein, partial [Allosphingosinicella sp.]|nr:histidine kinase dimerization/phospho-acceptor domain-containing protein [Allosphingosinicella sp.]